MASATVTQNGVVTSNPTKPYATDGYNSTWNGAAFVANDLADIRTFAAAQSIIPSQNGGEDRKDYDWRVTKAIMNWIANTYYYQGINSDNDQNSEYRAINILNLYNKKSLMIGGGMTAIDGMTHISGTVELALLDKWHSLPTQSANVDPGSVFGPSGTVYAMCMYNGDLYVAGNFTTVNTPTGSLTVNHIAKWNGNTWSALGTSTVGMAARVDALTTFNGKLIIAYRGTTAGGVSANRVAQWDGSVFTACGTNTAINNTVFALQVWNGVLYCGGAFTNAGRQRICSWDGGAGTGMVGLTGLSGTNLGNVNALCVFGSNLILAGAITSLGGVGYAGMAAWNGSALSTPYGSTGFAGTINALATFNSNLVAGGSFTSVDAVTSTKAIAQCNSNFAWAATGAGILTVANNNVLSLSSHDGNLFIGTDFAGKTGALGLDPGDYILKYDGATISAVGNGTSFNGSVNSFCEFPYHWACATLTKVLIGLCVAHGIPARLVAGTAPSSSDLDTLCEVYDPRNSKWVFVYLPYYGWVEDAAGVPQSGYEIMTANDSNSVTITNSGGVYSFTANNGMVGMPQAALQAPVGPRLSIQWWCGLPGDSTHKLFYDVNCDYTNRFNNQTAQSEQTVAVGSHNGAMAWNSTNVSYPLNQVQCTNAVAGGGSVTFTFTNNINDTTLGFTVDHYEKSENGGTSWTTITLTGGTTYVWTPSGSSVWFRGVSTSGAVSPTIKVSYLAQPGIRTSIGRPSMARPRTNGLPAAWRS